MSPGEIMKRALETLGIPSAEERYHGKKDKYIVWNESDSKGFRFVDNAPVEDRTFYQVHYFCPLLEEDDSENVRKKIKKALLKEGFYVGSVRKARDGGNTRHVTIEASIITSNMEE